MLDKKFEWLRDENVRTWEQIDAYTERAEKRLEELLIESRSRYGSVTFEGREYVYIGERIEDDDDPGSGMSRAHALLVGGGIEYDACGMDNILGWVELYDIIYEDGVISDVDHQLLYNIFTDDTWM